MLINTILEKIENFFDPRRHDKDSKNSFVFNIILGFTIILIFSVVLKDTRLKQEFMNSIFDQYILWRMDKDGSSFIDRFILSEPAADTATKKIARELMFFYFDDESIEMLQRPRLTPRDKTADLIRAAYKGGASIIVVDSLFSEPDKSDTKLLPGDKIPLNGAKRDLILYNLLKTIKDDKYSNTKVLLPIDTYADRTEQPNIFADLIDGKKIFAVTPMLSQFRSTTRFWIPYLQAKRAEGGEPYILWSIPIMTMTLTAGNLKDLHSLEEEILSDDDDSLNSYYLPVIKNGIEEDFEIYKEIYDDASKVERNTQANQYNRIQYVLYPAGVKSSHAVSGNININNLVYWKNLNNREINCKNKIVVIGRADANCNDFQFTPVGMMSGMFVQANAIATVLSISRPHLCSIFLHLTIEILLVIVTAYIILNFKGPAVGYSILFMFGSCNFLPFFYYCATNEFIYLNMAFMSLGFYNVSKVIEKVSWQGVSELSKYISMHERK